MVSVAAILAALGDWGAIPVNLAWIGITLVCCCAWARGRGAAIACFGALGATAVVVLAWTIGNLDIDEEEAGELAVTAAVGLLVIHFARQRNAALEEVRRSAQRERELVLERAHRLRTDLAVALGHAELMRHDGYPIVLGAVEAGGDLDVVIDELRKLRIGVNRLMGLEKADGGWKADSEIDLDRVFEGLAKRWVGTAPRRWTISNRVRGTTAGDKEELTLALDCLIENAVHATAEGDMVSLVTRDAGSEIVIEASDSGCGISREALPRIFEPFVRGHDGDGGLGLGLAMTKAIIENQGGTIAVDSEIGRGTTFRIRLARPSPSAADGDPSATPVELQSASVRRLRSAYLVWPSSSSGPGASSSGG